MSAGELEAAPVPASARLRHVPRLVLVVAVVAGLYAVGPAYRGTFFLTFLVDVVILGLAALGLQHMVGSAGVLNLGQAAFFGLGAYGGVWTLQHWHWGTLPALGAAIVVALGGAVLMAPLLRLRGVYFAMASFAFGAMMFEVFGQAVSLTGGENGLFLIPPPRVFGHTVMGGEEDYFLVLTVALVCYGAYAALARSGYGLSLHAVRQSENGARAAGVNVARMHFVAVCLGVVPAALAGVLYAQVHGIVQATIFDYNQSVSLITMVIVGGVASRWGAFAGALLAQYVSVYPQVIAEYRFLLYGGVIAVLMIVLPGGLASVAPALRRRLRVLRVRRGRGAAL
ncbi:MAG: branched-chain amino acid ABC transporter permease [Chloroflexota bacterium]|nr:branched-chain amino acid ABC transporter permease [Chloroflexota bacterium]